MRAYTEQCSSVRKNYYVYDYDACPVTVVTAPRLPDKVAFTNGEYSLTFGALSRAAKGIGTFLAQKGFCNEPVVVFMEKHPCSVAAFFGVVYAGCYYVPIDEEMPRYRVELIFRNLNPRAVLCDEKTRPMIAWLPAIAR